MVIILFESLLIVLAFGLALWWGIDLAGSIELSQGAVLLGIAAAILPNLFLAWAAFGVRASWMVELRERTAKMMRQVFGARPRPVAVVAVAFGGVAEELLFRGVLIPALGEYMPVWLAVVTVGAAFGLLHPLTRVYALLAALLGIFWGALFVWTGNLLVPIIAHALNNLIAVVSYGRASPE